MQSIGKFAKRVGVTVKTLQQWDRTGKLKAARTVTGKRMYSDDHFAKAVTMVEAKK